ncbi:ribonuclease T2 family protein [Celerinatantimonas sp. MCCC 1A17872]|uniref:ribonuclease T2 family protein n=1 Tax=Celerinatantimonas sp. MCCC 1A17872 TaxID=3177514 RepID=UPI0038C526DC
MSRILYALILSAMPLCGLAQQCQIDDSNLNLHYDQQLDYQNVDIKTDFFMLVFSNSRRFCKGREEQPKFKFQCASGNQFGWVVHGLWGESKAAYLSGNIHQHPRFCQGDLPKLALSTIKPYLCMSPGTALLQGEWEKHGACDFTDAKSYFAKEQSLYQQFKLPPVHLNASQAIKWMKQNNVKLKDKWLSKQGSEFGICFDKKFSLISCPKK